MKNIYVITDKPSKGYILGKCIKELSDVKIGQFTRTHYLMFDEEYFQAHNIYITSDEEIKKGDWVLVGYVLNHPDTENRLNGDTNPIKKLIAKENLWKFSDGTNLYGSTCVKIILTTDQNLIKDGVQEIDDEFLGWFVKNSNCEEVKIEDLTDYNHQPDYKFYGIIIPKEKPEQVDIDWSGFPKSTQEKVGFKEDLKIDDNTNFGVITDINEKSVCFGKNDLGDDIWYKKDYVVKFPNLILKEELKQPIQKIIDENYGENVKIDLDNNTWEISFKQETLEEAAERIYQEDFNNPYLEEVRRQNIKDAMIKLAKWQAERMYSEEEILKIITEFKSYLSFGDEVDETQWFEKFKKK